MGARRHWLVASKRLQTGHPHPRPFLPPQLLVSPNTRWIRRLASEPQLRAYRINRSSNLELLLRQNAAHRTGSFTFYRESLATSVKRGEPPHLIGYSRRHLRSRMSPPASGPTHLLGTWSWSGSQVQCHQEGSATRGALRLLRRIAATINGRWIGLPESINSAVELSEYVDAKAGAGMLHNPITALRFKEVIEVNTNVLTMLQ